MAEKRAFLHFVESPYYGARPECIRLARHILEEKTNAGLSKAVAHPVVFGPESGYDDARMRKVMEQLLRLLEQFLVTQEREKDVFNYQIQLARQLAERKQFKRFRRLTETPLPFPGDEGAWTVEQFEQAALWYQLVYDQRSAMHREHDAWLYQRIIRYQSVALLARRLRGACIFQSNRKEKEEPPADPLLRWAAEHLPEADYGTLPLLSTLLAGFFALQNPENPEYFRQFRDGLLAHPDCFSIADQRDLLVVAINYCSQRYNGGDTAYLDTQLALYEHGLREGLLLENNWVTGYTFTNISTLALIGRRYDWLEQFLRDFGEKIEPRFRESSYAFNQARLDYALKRYQPALQQLQRDIFDDLLLNISAKTVQAKCFFELDEYDLLETHLEAMRKFIRRHKEIGYYGERYLNFTVVLRRIIRRSPEHRAEVKAALQGMSVLAEKEWLLGLEG